MSILGIIFKFLTGFIEIPEAVGIIAASAVPIAFEWLSREFLKKRGTKALSEPMTITIKASSGESVKIKLGNMSDEEAKETVGRLRDLAAKANVSTSTTQG
jgi:hypothetical protein